MHMQCLAHCWSLPTRFQKDPHPLVRTNKLFTKTLSNISGWWLGLPDLAKKHTGENLILDSNYCTGHAYTKTLLFTWTIQWGTFANWLPILFGHITWRRKLLLVENYWSKPLLLNLLLRISFKHWFLEPSTQRIWCSRTGLMPTNLYFHCAPRWRWSFKPRNAPWIVLLQTNWPGKYTPGKRKQSTVLGFIRYFSGITQSYICIHTHTENIQRCGVVIYEDG